MRNKGIALVWVAVTILIIIGIVGLSLDYGALALNVHQLQNAADAAALAGARTVKFDHTATRDWAIDIARRNLTDGLSVSIDRNEQNKPDGELVLGRWVRQERRFYPTPTGTNAVLVVGRRLGQRADAPPLSLLFGQPFNMSSLKAVRGAIAISIGSTGAGIICLAKDPNRYGDGSMGNAGLVLDDSVLDLRGPPDSGIVGDIQVNADSVRKPKYAVNANGRPVVWAGELNVVGLTNPDPVDWKPLYGDGIPFNVNTGSLPVADPLAYLNDTPPDIGSMPVHACPDMSGGGTATIEPGYYPNGIDPTGGEITMGPGFYAVGGGIKPNQPTGLAFNGGRLIGDAVTIYIAEGAKMDIGANAYVDLSSPGDFAHGNVDGLNGVILWQDIDNHNEATLIGSSDSPIRGTLYFPDCLMRIGGGTDQLGNQVLAGALRVHGTVRLGVGYDGRNTIKAYKSVLVQ